MKGKLLVLLVVSLVGSINCSKALVVPSGEYTYHIAPDGNILESITIDNEETTNVNVTITKEGQANQWIFLQDSSFSIPASSSYQFYFYIIVPESTTEGNYTGNITFNYNNGNSTNSITKQIKFIVESINYNIIDGVWLYNNMAFGIGDYLLFFTSVSPPNSCFTKVIKNGLEIFNEPVDNSPIDIDEHLRVSVTQAYDSGTIQSCRYVVISDEQYTYQITDIPEGSVDNDTITANINVYGTLKQGLPVMFELVNSKGKLLSGKLILTSPVIGAIEILGDGLYTYTLSTNETGPIAVKAYLNDEQIAHRVFTIIDGSNINNNDTNGYDNNYPIIGSGELLVFYNNEISPSEDLIIRIKDNYTGSPIINAHVWIKSPCGIDFESYTDNQGMVTFNKPIDGWCSGQYTFEIRRAGYKPNPSIYNFIVESQKLNLDVNFVYSGVKVNTAYVGYEVIINLVDPNSKQVINYDGYANLISPNGNKIELNFVDGSSRFTPNIKGNYVLTIPEYLLSLGGLNYFEVNDSIEIIDYVNYDLNNVINIVVIIIAVVVGLALLVFIARRLSKSSNNKRTLPKIRPVSNNIPPNSEPF